MMIEIIATLYLGSLIVLAFYGAVGFVTIYFFCKHWHTKPHIPLIPSNWPNVTIQLPVFNEIYVVKSLIHTILSLKYPQEKLQVQILDDSDDETIQVTTKLVNYYKTKGYDICLIHRKSRKGFKAGALENGLKSATGEYIVIFDADFLPEPDFLIKTLPYLIENPNMCMIQTRWGHLNISSSLTSAQAIAIDKHFVIEQFIRHNANLYPKFNGTAGVWRRACIEESGGWQSDTVCEDLCLSTRAILSGWEFYFLPDVVVPAELPSSILSYKIQQARWAKGSLQCLSKFGLQIFKDKKQTAFARFYALFTMSAYCTHLLLITILLLQLPLTFLNYQVPIWIIGFSFLGLSQPILFIISQISLYSDWKRKLLNFPLLILITVGLAPTYSIAIFQAFSKSNLNFIRTPKSGNNLCGKYLPGKQPTKLWFFEGFLLIYTLASIAIVLWQGKYHAIVLPFICMLGLSYILSTTYFELRTERSKVFRVQNRMKMDDSIF